ncbi:hypothetical protein AB0G04_43810 [Actinoplanes sp. NPDC023801]|uniref:hypothetical protein n=1 Tax=Actinoplanes sp. NPDC023801 TaxID=3154595 RepID=UPI0033FB04F5
MNLRRKIGTSVATVVMAATSTIVGAAPAHAAHRCGDEFIGIPYNQDARTTLMERTEHGVRIELKIKQFPDVGEAVFARISGATRSGEQVWLDWSYTGGDGWAQCGPFTVSERNKPNTSAAADRYSGRGTLTFRACALVRGGGYCTEWWT